jgi:hypothetical protein
MNYLCVRKSKNMSEAKTERIFEKLIGISHDDVNLIVEYQTSVSESVFDPRQNPTESVFDPEQTTTLANATSARDVGVSPQRDPSQFPAYDDNGNLQPGFAINEETGEPFYRGFGPNVAAPVSGITGVPGATSDFVGPPISAANPLSVFQAELTKAKAAAPVAMFPPTTSMCG